MVREPASQTASAPRRNLTPIDGAGGGRCPRRFKILGNLPKIGVLYSWPSTVLSSLVMVVPMVW
jgi:hypothetical protein